MNDNGTPTGKKAKHGWSTNHRCDDFLTGVEYKPLRAFRGGKLPDLLANGGDGRLTYLKFDFTGEDELRFVAGKRYAFMVGFEEAGDKRNFTLANTGNSHSQSAPSLKGTPYDGGWGLRREGNSFTPPQFAAEPPKDEAVRAKLLEQSRFPVLEERLKIAPTTDGYPDVDTYRDFEFYLIARPEETK